MFSSRCWCSLPQERCWKNEKMNSWWDLKAYKRRITLTRSFFPIDTKKKKKKWSLWNSVICESLILEQRDSISSVFQCRVECWSLGFLANCEIAAGLRRAQPHCHVHQHRACGDEGLGTGCATSVTWGTHLTQPDPPWPPKGPWNPIDLKGCWLPLGVVLQQENCLFQGIAFVCKAFT